VSIVGFIFARGGSKGLPGKNIRPLAGKPLINWSIEQALAVDRIERLIVSTDSEEIASIAMAAGAEVPFKRPIELSGDTSPEWHAWRHALNYVKETSGQMPQAMVSIPTTAPLRHVSDIERCLDMYELGGADIVITVTDANRSPYFNMVNLSERGDASIVIPPKKIISGRQQAPEVFDMTTVAYVANSEFVLSKAGVFDGRVKAVHVPKERAIDIDTLFDFRIAEFLMEQTLKEQCK
jgi:CMP-N-acetylneuraminic acid synthetase